MGIFNLLNKNPVIPRTDLVWATQAGKLKGTRDYLKKNRADLCVAWFAETHRAFSRGLNEENGMNIEIRMADSLRLYDLNNKTAVFLEHYPVFTKEENLLLNNKPAEVCFMNSLDDILFQIFRGNIAKMMAAMGLKEDEYIESGMVTGTIMKAQKKMERQVRQDFNARSAQEWMNSYGTYYRQHRH